MIEKLIPEEGEVKVESPSSVCDDERRRREEKKRRSRSASSSAAAVQPAATSSPPSAASVGNKVGSQCLGCVKLPLYSVYATECNGKFHETLALIFQTLVRKRHCSGIIGKRGRSARAPEREKPPPHVGVRLVWQWCSRGWKIAGEAGTVVESYQVKA